MAGRIAKFKLTDDELVALRARVVQGVTNRSDLAVELGYAPDTFKRICVRQPEVRQILAEASKPVPPYCSLAKSKPKPRSSRAGRPLKEVPEHRIPDIEYWAEKGYSKKRICDEMRVPLKTFNAQAKADERLIEAFELGCERHAHRQELTLEVNGNDGGAQFLLKAKHSMRDTAPANNDNRTQIVHVSINEAMPREKFLEYIDA